MLLKNILGNLRMYRTNIFVERFLFLCVLIKIYKISVFLQKCYATILPSHNNLLGGKNERD